MTALEFPHDDVPVQLPLVYDRRTMEPIPSERLGELFDGMFANRLVAYTAVHEPDGARSVVSTIFLGLDHAIPGGTHDGPVLFETAVFDGTGLVWRARSRTEHEARTAHVHALGDLLATLEREGEQLPSFLLEPTLAAAAAAPHDLAATQPEPESPPEELTPEPELPAPSLPESEQPAPAVPRMEGTP